MPPEREESPAASHAGSSDAVAAGRSGDDHERLEVARLEEERDAFLRLLLQSRSGSAWGLGSRWQPSGRRNRLLARLIERPLYTLRLVLTLQRPRGLRVNPLFDEAWYRETYGDAPPGRRAAYAQFRRLSITDGRDPNAWFDTDWYLDHNSDVKLSHVHPIDHYLEIGWRENRNPGPDFIGFDYMRHHPECVAMKMNPLVHKLRAGSDGVIANPGVETRLLLRRIDQSMLRRVMLHQRRYGTRRTLRRALDEMARFRAQQALAAEVAPVADEVQPQMIEGAVDSPKEGALEGSSVLIVSGWAFSDSGVQTVDIYLDGAKVDSALLRLPRPDVSAKHGDTPHSRDSGFSARIPLDDVDPGRHVLQVVMRDTAGDARVFISSFERMEPESLYHHFYVRSLPNSTEVAKLEAVAAKRTESPQLHLLVYDLPDGDLGSTLASIAQQTYPAWRCTILVKPDRIRHAEALVRALPRHDRRRRWAVVADPAEALPTRRRSSRFIGVLHAGEQLAPAALLRFVDGSGSEADIIYSDHDEVLRNGRHVSPWFVGDWSPDQLLAQDYIGGFFLARDTSRFRELAVPSLASDDASRRYGLLLALTDEPAVVAHVPQVLWSASESGRQDGERADRDLALVADTLARRGGHGQVETIFDGSDGPVRSITWSVETWPLVSIVIPTTGRIDLVTETLDSLDRSDYPATETIFIDNSRGRNPDGIRLLRERGATVVERDEEFNWAKLNNDGAAIATGEMLLFLNDDMEVTDPGWLTELVREAQREDVGAVGPLLLYPDGKIQHAGVFIVGHGGGAVHLFHRMDPENGIYLGLQRVTREVSAVTGACLLVRRVAFEEVGGFDEELAVVGNDVDLCLRLTRAGRRTLWTPRSSLVHHESISRSGVDHLPDEDRMWARWSDVLLSGDPHYNPNLAQDRVDAALDWPKVSHRVDPVTELDPAAGVNLVGYIRAEMGIGEATRGEAQGLVDVDVPFVIIDHQQGNPARMKDASWAHKVVEQPVFDTNILHLNADVLPSALAMLPSGLQRGRRNIGYWTWELPEFPRRWHGSFALVDEVWVPSEFVRKAVSAEAPVPVRVVPHAVREPVGPLLDRTAFDLPRDTFQFLAMYDTQSVQERKNPQGAVTAFTRAFEAEDPSVAMVLKVNNAGSRELDELRRLAERRANLHLITDVLTRDEMDSLMAGSDVFVSLHRAEGFGLPMAEAMALGRAVIATGWSGNVDFMAPGTAALVGYELVELRRSYGPYEAGQHWADPDVDEAATWMRRLESDRLATRMMGERAAEAIRRTNGPAVVGRTMADYLVHR